MIIQGQLEGTCFLQYPYERLSLVKWRWWPVSVGKGWPSHLSSNFFPVQFLHLPQNPSCSRSSVCEAQQQSHELKDQCSQERRFFPILSPMPWCFLGKEDGTDLQPWLLQPSLGNAIPLPSVALQGAMLWSDTWRPEAKCLQASEQCLTGGSICLEY